MSIDKGMKMYRCRCGEQRQRLIRIVETKYDDEAKCLACLKYEKAHLDAGDRMAAMAEDHYAQA